MSKKEATFTAYVRTDGKITVPRSLRDALSIEEGDLVECSVRKVKRTR